MTNISVTPIAITQPVVDFIPDPEGLIAYTARVSNPSNQSNFETADRLLTYCAKHSHWSVFEMCNMVIEIKAPRDISRQILRHKTACFQEFSQRYAEISEDMFCIREARLQDSRNRQNSLTLEDEDLQAEWDLRQREVLSKVKDVYRWAIDNGIAKECARVILPEGNTMSCLYMNANIRTWIHYCKLRTGNGTQSEHVGVATLCRSAILEYMPNLSSYMEIPSQ